LFFGVLPYFILRIINESKKRGAVMSVVILLGGEG
jgi:hypothetical protein